MSESATRARLFFAQYQSFRLDLPFWSRLASETGGPILEMGCGTGRLVTLLAQEGYRIIGLDQDSEMIALAKKHLTSHLRTKVTWLIESLSGFTLHDPIQLAIGALNTFAYLDDRQFKAALKSAGACLGDGGLIALDLPPEHAAGLTELEATESLDSFVDPESGNAIEVRASVKIDDRGHARVTWKYDELFPDGKVRRHLWEQMYYMRSIDKLQTLITDCDLSIRAIFGGYDYSAYRSKARRLLLVIHRV